MSPQLVPCAVIDHFIEKTFCAEGFLFESQCFGELKLILASARCFSPGCAAQHRGGRHIHASAVGRASRSARQSRPLKRIRGNAEEP